MNTKWIFAAGMRRAGSTLQYHLIREAIEFVGGVGLGLVSWQDFAKIYEEHEGKYPFVLVKGHVFYPKYYPFLLDHFKQSKAKAFYIYRDIRDVAASTLQLSNYTWDYIIQEEIPSILKEWEEWRTLEYTQISISRYEAFNALSFMRDAAYWLLSKEVSLSLPMECYEVAVTKHSIESHRKILEKQKKPFDNNGSVMWKNHITDGKIGKFNDVLVAEQIRQVEEVAKDWLIARQYME